MKLSYLFPSYMKKIGWVLLIPSLTLGLLTVMNDWSPNFLTVPVFAIFIDEFIGNFRIAGIVDNNILDEICGVIAIISALMVAFAKEADEDELISRIRLESLVWATYVNYGILMLGLILVYDLAFLWVMIGNMFTILLFFIIRFNWIIWKLRKSIEDDK